MSGVVCSFSFFLSVTIVLIYLNSSQKVVEEKHVGEKRVFFSLIFNVHATKCAEKTANILKTYDR